MPNITQDDEPAKVQGKGLCMRELVTSQNRVKSKATENRGGKRR
jgi:hypothetical protein